MNEELKPCHWCEEDEVVVEKRRGGQAVFCPCCHAMGPQENTHEEAIAAWNRRAEAPTVKDSLTVQAQPVAMTDERLACQDARHAIDGAIAYGRLGINPPPSPTHWLAEYWNMGALLSRAPVAAQLNAEPLNDEAVHDLAQRHAHADWGCSNRDDGYIRAVKAIVNDVLSIVAPVAAQASEPVAEVDDAAPGLVNWLTWQNLPAGTKLYAAPQPTAEAVRNAAYEQAASLCASAHTPFWTASAIEAANHLAEQIRALQSAPPQPAEQPSEFDPLELTAELHRAYAMKVLADVEAIAQGRTDAHWAGFQNAIEEVRHRLVEQPSAPINDCSTDECRCDECEIQRGEWAPVSDEQPSAAPAAPVAQWQPEPKLRMLRALLRAQSKRSDAAISIIDTLLARATPSAQGGGHE